MFVISKLVDCLQSAQFMVAFSRCFGMCLLNNLILTQFFYNSRLIDGDLVMMKQDSTSCYLPVTKVLHVSNLCTAVTKLSI